MLIAIVLDRPLAEAKALVDDPAAFIRKMSRILRKKQSHPQIAQMKPKLLGQTWSTHGWHTSMTVVLKSGHHGVLMVDHCPRCS